MISDNHAEDYLELDSITPPPSQQETVGEGEIQKQIVVRPPQSKENNTCRQSRVRVQREVSDSTAHRLAVRRSERNKGVEDFFPASANYALMAKTLEPEPQTLTEALTSSDKAKWKQAWEAELSSLARNNTWVLESLPAHRTAIGCRWLFRRKDDGRFKARLVAKGFSQKLGLDYEETFAPVAKFTTIRLLLALCCESDWELYGMDVKTAFLNSELEETVYMEIPEGVSIPAAPVFSTYQQPTVCRLLKSIYGLKQSPRAWYGRIHTFFQSNNFVRSNSDHSLFINTERQVILLLYVDDLVLAAPTYDQINWIRYKLHIEFEMTDLGKLKSFLGLEIHRNREKRTLHLSQRQYTQKILQAHGMENCNPARTPADPHVRLEKSHTSFVANPTSKQQYQSAVGSLMYCMLGTRPDIAYAVSKVTQYCSNPNQAYWNAVKRIVRYLAGTRNRGLYYGLPGPGIGYTNADWGSSEDRRSIGGYTFILNGAAVSWNSKKQSMVALSSTEAEYIALTQAVKESLWLQAILVELRAGIHAEEVQNISVDNQGALALAKNPQFHARTKHIDIQYHFIRHFVERRQIKLTYCPTTEMTADIFTKALPQPAFVKHNLALGLIDHSVPVLQSTMNQQSGSDHDWSESASEGRCCKSPALTPSIHHRGSLTDHQTSLFSEYESNVGPLTVV